MVLNTEWAQVEVIDLINDGSGLAFGIIGGRSTGVVVKTILPGGVADRDGRLQSGDHILQIGDVNLRGLGSEQVASVLRQCGVHVRMVVARPVEPTSPDYQALGSHAPIVPTKLLGDPEELDRHLVEHGYAETFSHTTTQPNYPQDTYIYSRTSSELDFHPLSGIVDVVKDPLPIGPTPVIPTATRTPSVGGVELLPLDMALRGAPPPETETFDVELHKDDYGLGITVAGYVCEKEELSGIFIKSISAGSAAAICKRIHVNDRIVKVGAVSLQGFTNHQAVEVLRHTGPVVKLRLERYLRGPKYEQLQQAIRANQLKPPSPPSPSVSSLPKYSVITDGYSVTEIELECESHTTMTSSVLVEQATSNTPVNEDVEIVIDMPSYCPSLHRVSTPSPADKIIQDKWRQVLGRDMDIIVAHLVKDSKGGLGISLEGTVDVEDGQEVRPHHYIRSILPDGPVGINGMLASGDELLEVNGTLLLGLNHLEVVRCLKTLPPFVVLVCARHSEHSAPHRIINTSQDRAAFATRSILGGSLQNLIPLSESSRLVKAKSDSSLTSSVATAGELSGSRSKSRSLEPVTGLAAWSDLPQVIELYKGERGGLGFSILDYQDPVNPAETVIVIRSLVPGGVAQSDGRLIPGDRLLAVNDTPLARASLDRAVQVLKGAPKGVVRIAVAKPLPCHDTVSQSSQECIDDDAEDHTCLDDYHECLEEYQEGLEVVQICVDDNRTPVPPISHENSQNSLKNISPLNSPVTPTTPTQPNDRKLVPASPPQSDGIAKSIPYANNVVAKPDRHPSVQTETFVIDIETRYKQEVNTCLRVPEVSDDKDGYETCLEEVDSSDVSTTLDLPTVQEKSAAQSLSSTEHLETKEFSKKDHVSLANEFETELKSYDDPTDSFGGDQFFLVEYIDEDPNSERVYVPEVAESEEYKVLSKTEHDMKYGGNQMGPLSYKLTNLDRDDTISDVVVSDDSVVVPRTPRRYVRCLSEYYNDYEECLEEYRMYSQSCNDNTRGDNHSQDEVEDTTLVGSRDVSTDDFSGMVTFSPRSCSAPDILGTSFTIAYDPGEDFEKYRRKSTVPNSNLSEPDESPMTVTRSVLDSGGGYCREDIMADSHWGPQRLVQVVRSPTGGSLGISIVGGKVDLYNAESVLGIFVKNVVPQSPAGLTGELKTGDRILEVDGVDLRHASHEKAVDAIRSAGNPVSFLVQSLIPWGEGDIPNNIGNNIALSPAHSVKCSERVPTPHVPRSRSPELDATEEAILALASPVHVTVDNAVAAVSRPGSARSMRADDAGPSPAKSAADAAAKLTPVKVASQQQPPLPSIVVEDEVAATSSSSKPAAAPQKYSDSEPESSDDEEDTRDQEGRMYTAKGQEIDRASAGNVKRTKEEVDADPEPEDDFGYTNNKVKKKYNNLGGTVLMVQLERGPRGSLGLSLAGHRDRNTMAVFVVGLNPSGAAHRLGASGIHVGDEILEVNGIVLHGRCHLNASAIIKGLSGPIFKVIILRRKTALEDIAVRPITQFPVSLEEETAEEKYSNFRNVRTVTIKKGTQSLGIMIIEGKHAEVGQGIFISDIQEGSAAEKAGLDIGDMILAVNKDSLVSASYDTAANLLKKTEGLVVLVVCNPNKRGDGPAGDAAAPGVGGKTPSRPPSRPTSAADKATAGGLRTSAPPSRPTTPINEPVADPSSCAITPGKETVIDIATESKALGLSFVGGKDTLIPKGIIVNEVYPNGALAKDGRLKPGDQILEINGAKLADVTHTTASCAIRQILPKIRLIVFRPEKVEYNNIDVELTKKPGKGLGLGVMARKTEPGVYISDILHGGIADVDGRIMRGDAVISVNGADLTTATAEQAAAALKTAAGRISIKLQRYKPPAPR